MSGWASALVAVLLAAGGSLYAPRAFAQYANSGVAKSSCDSWSASRGYGACVYEPKPQASTVYNAWCSVHNGANAGCYLFFGEVPPPSCGSLPAFDMMASIGTAGSKKMCQPGAGGGVGNQGCTLVLTQFGNAFQSSSGAWKTHVHVTGDGSACTKSTDGSPDTFGTGASQLPPENVPPLPSLPTPPTIEPQICQDGTCYDPNTGDVTAMAGGSKLHVPVQNMKSGDGGACFSDGSSALCAGAPQAPTPPSPPIVDPATQVKAVDHYATATDTGSGQTIAVVVYTPPGVSVSSGKASGDDGPAKPSSVGSAAGQFGGGGDCATPPVCSGDVVMCGAARTQWATTCQVHKDLAGTTAPPSLTEGQHSAADVWSDGTATGDSVADAANAGSYDVSGMGFSSACPLHDMVVPLPGGRSFPIKFSAGCEVGGWLKAIIIAFALFAAARITGGGVG